MPPHWNLERLIGTALVDEEFRERLLRTPAAAALDFDLTEEEIDLLNSASTSSLEELSACINAWITRATQPRRATSPCWIPEGSWADRVAV